MTYAALSSTCQTCGCAETSCATCRFPNDCTRCSSCCCSNAHQSWRRIRIGTAVRVEYLSSAWMTVEIIGSIGLGLIVRSFALLAFGGDSLVELISGLAVLTYLRTNTSGSEVHRKERTELVTSLLLFSLIPVIGLGAAYTYLTGLRPEDSPLGDRKSTRLNSSHSDRSRMPSSA